MVKLRITKYNPIYRDENGFFKHNEWTSFHDIGKSFDGKLFTLVEYNKIENHYLNVIQILFKKAGIFEMTLKDFESCNSNDFKLDRDLKYTLSEIREFSRSILREELWALFQNSNDCYLHFGYDYYMYMGLPNLDIKEIYNTGIEELFIEEVVSPYLK